MKNDVVSELTSHVSHHQNGKKRKLQSTPSYSKARVSTPVFEQVNTAAGSLAASASEKQDEGTAADTHQVQPAVALQMACSAIASQAPLGALSARAAPAARAESAIKQNRSKEKITERAMGVIGTRKGGFWRLKKGVSEKVKSQKSKKKVNLRSPREF